MAEKAGRSRCPTNAGRSRARPDPPAPGCRLPPRGARSGGASRARSGSLVPRAASPGRSRDRAPVSHSRHRVAWSPPQTRRRARHHPLGEAGAQEELAAGAVETELRHRRPAIVKHGVPVAEPASKWRSSGPSSSSALSPASVGRTSSALALAARQKGLSVALSQSSAQINQRTLMWLGSKLTFLPCFQGI